jgi:glycosyltransferase involved in cell wall biosynthesis
MRVAYVCSDPGVPVFGTKGASIHVRELCRALSGLGHEVLILSPRVVGDRPPGFDVRVETILVRPSEAAARVDRAVTNDLRALRSATALFEQGLSILHAFRPDIVYERYSLFGTGGSALAAELDVPLIVEVNAPLSDEQSSYRELAFVEAARRLERDVLCSADRVVAVSPALERWLIGLGVEAHRIAVVGNGADVARLRPALDGGASVRARLGLEEEPVVGFVGSLKTWHDVPTLVRAVACLRQTGRDARLLVVGDGPERSRLEELAVLEGLAGAAVFVGQVPHEQVPAYLAAMAVAVAPYSAADDFYFSPLKLVEYLAAGRPVVAAAVGEIGHCIQPRETGLLYPPGNERALAVALAELLDDPGGAARLGLSGREHVRAFHTWEQNAHAVTELAAEALALKAAT